MASNFGWHYDVTRIDIPYFMTAGTGKSDDAGVKDITKEYAGVCPLESLIENYNSISADVMKIRARATGAEHEAMLMRTDGYMTVWMLYHLKSDEDAAKVFFGENAEILHKSENKAVRGDTAEGALDIDISALGHHHSHILFQLLRRVINGGTISDLINFVSHFDLLSDYRLYATIIVS